MGSVLGDECCYCGPCDLIAGGLCVFLTVFTPVPYSLAVCTLPVCTDRARFVYGQQ